MNVLVYLGPGTTSESVKHCVELLRLHLSPYYAIVTVGETALLKDPWMYKTLTLVMPGGADLPFCDVLNGHGNSLISQFVRKGGKFIGFCAGAYYAARRCEFEVGTPMEVSGPRELAFYPGTKAGCAYKGFVYESHAGLRITPLATSLPGCPATVYNYYNGGGVFIEPEKHRNVEVLANFTETLDVDTASTAAVVYCKVGKGDVLLSGTHPEFTPDLMKPGDDAHYKQVAATLTQHDEGRRIFLQQCLKKLGLRVNEDANALVPKVTPVYIAGVEPTKVFELVNTLKTNLELIGNTHEDANDTLAFHGPEERIMAEDDDVKHFQFFTNGAVPEPKLTPYFDMAAYLAALRSLRESNRSFRDIGSVIGYGEVVTSTNTLLEKNVHWLQHLPHGLVLTATTQVAGRGRGGNVWINPKGVMALSVLFRVPGGAQQPLLIVALQYLCGLAVVEAIFSYGSDQAGKGVGYEDMPVKLKWPNDIYALKPEYYKQFSDKDDTSNTVDGDDAKWAKISGALINSQFLNGSFHLVWGCGINVLNSAPTTSLNLVLELLNELRARKGLEKLPPYRHELLLAKIMFIIDEFYSVFRRQGLAPFLPLYYKRWFHSDQQVKLDRGDGSPQRTMIIKAITPDYGLLVAEDAKTGERVELQPDGNSFDIFKGLVYKKRV